MKGGRNIERRNEMKHRSFEKKGKMGFNLNQLKTKAKVSKTNAAHHEHKFNENVNGN